MAIGSFDATKQIYGRRKITTNLRFTGDANTDATVIQQILEKAITIHKLNVEEETNLWDIYVNDGLTWEKKKSQRSDINNKVSMDNAWAITRTLNGYIFGEPVKYVGRREGSQEKVETLSQFLDYSCNQNATMNATMSASICGLGYKLALPTTNTEFDETGVPFKVNSDIIYPQTAFCVYTDEAIAEKILGVLIGTYTDEEGNTANKYTCWTKNFQFVFVEKYNGYEPIAQTLPDMVGGETIAYPIVCGRIPLVEVERNPFRKGDWEIATDLLALLSKVTSDRIDDIDCIIDYILVLTNCDFKDESERDAILNERVLELDVTNPNIKPTVEILKNSLDQTGVQKFVDYLEKKLHEIVGVPSRNDNSNSGQDTGQAVKYRNGFRDLENNAGVIIPKFERAEMEFLAVCISYSVTHPECGISELKPYDVRLKFSRSLNDDVSSAATAFSTYVNAGCDYEQAFLLSGGTTDPAEASKKVLSAWSNRNTFLQLSSQQETSQETDMQTDSLEAQNATTETTSEVETTDEQNNTQYNTIE